MENLRVTLIQSTLHWEQPQRNRKMFEEKIDFIEEQTDVIVLPEMFTTGFSMKPKELAETMQGETVDWMQRMARKKSAVVTGSLIIEEGGDYFNRLIWMQPNGKLDTYDKRHLFSLAGEENHYKQGDRRVVVELNGWKIALFVCYDLRFPVWSRNKSEYDVALYIANWPERRSFPWKQLMIARAIENQSYVIGLNRVGDDGNKVSHSGDSAIIDALGEKISTLEAHDDGLETISLSMQDLQDVRQKFQFLNDQDQFEIHQ